MAYRVYKALYPFSARDGTEVSMMPDDYLFVYMKDDGTWPNDTNWMKGTNHRTNETGDFPGGNYSVLVEEVVPQPDPPPPPVVQQPVEQAPPPPPRRGPARGRGMSPPTISEEGGPPVAPRASPAHVHVRQHDMFKITIQLPLTCVVCDDYIWGSAGAGYRCQFCSVVCHATCQEACKTAIKCDSSLQAPEDSNYRDYAYTVNSFLDFSETDVESWMRAANIDVYWECFKNGGITTGRQLQELDENSLRILGISDELHLQVVMECLNELCRPTQVSSLNTTSDDQPDIGAWKRLSGQFAINMVRSPSNLSVSGIDRESKKKGERAINGHSFSVHSYATPTKCDFCSRYMLGLIRQGLKCKACNRNVHKMCLRENIPTCDMWKTGHATFDIFGTELASQFDCQREKGPPVVLKCIEMIEERGLKVEGIYRVSASLGDMNKLKEELNRGVAGINVRDPRWADIHVFSGALKLYLRDLPEPIFTYQMYSDFIKAGRSSKDYDTIYKNVQPLVDNLPPHNKLTLETILTHLIKVVNEQHHNKMNHNNLALVFGPTLMRPKPDQIAELVGNCDVHCRVVDVLLQKGPWNIKPPDVSSLRGVKPDNVAPPVPVRTGVSKRGGTPIAPRPSYGPVPEEADGPPPVTPPSSAPSIPLSECGWYWQDISREEVTAKLKDAPEGSFLVRDSQRGAYTLTVKKGGQNKLVRIINNNGQYGFSDPTQYKSVPDLIDHYREVSLSQYNPRLDVKLLHPVSRFAKISDEGVEEEEDEDRENDVEELLEKLKDVTELFDCKNEVYLEMEKKSEAMKIELENIRTVYSGFGNVAEMLKEQLDFLRHHDLTASILVDRDRRCIMDNGKLLGKRLEQAEASHRKAMSDMMECNNRFRALDRDLNTLRPDLMRLQWEKDQYTSKLVQEGLTHHEISERVKDKAMNESESIYGTLYGTLEGQDEDEEDGGIYEPPPEIQNIQYPGPTPPPRSGSRPPPPIPPSTRTPELGPAPPPTLRKPSTGDRMPIPPPHTKIRVKPPVPTLEDRPHVRQETWYVECDRPHAEMHLRNKQDGTFLCRPSGKAMQNAKGGLHTHTIDIVYQGIKHLKVVQDSNKYGFSVPCNYNSLIDLVLHYSENSLETHNPKLTTTLAYPVYS